MWADAAYPVMFFSEKSGLKFVWEKIHFILYDFFMKLYAIDGGNVIYCRQKCC